MKFRGFVALYEIRLRPAPSIELSAILLSCRAPKTVVKHIHE
jgi:hypothetical protein